MVEPRIAARADTRTHVPKRDDITAQKRRTRTMELEGLRWTPEAIRLADGERLCVVEADGNKRPGGSSHGGRRNGVIEATHLTLGTHLAQRYLRLAVFPGRWLLKIAAGHISRHDGAVAGHGGFHRARSSRATGCQPTEGQHHTQQQDEECPQ